MTDGVNATAADTVCAESSPLSAGGGMGLTQEAALIDRLIDLLLALEPFEVKQGEMKQGEAGLGEVGLGAVAQDANTGSRPGPGGGGGGVSGCCPESDRPDVDGSQAAPLVTGQSGGADVIAKPSAESTRAMLGRMRAVLDREAARLGEDGLEGKAAVDQVALIARTLEKIDQMERLIAEDANRASGERLSGEEREQMRRTVRQLILSAAERMVAERVAEGGADGLAGGDGDGPAGCEESESSDPANAGSLDPGAGPG
ncbi:MAG: hypothetical protein RIC18_05140 [Hoeflea sp.]|uniref:hypothetical protein n=1 Tax=Hoeflea sp. TaxID=1940281 RepID=UPI0032EC2CAD